LSLGFHTGAALAANDKNAGASTDAMASTAHAVLRATRTSAEWEETLGISKRVSAVDPGWHGEIRLR
jgi:hypothetical protein